MQILDQADILACDREPLAIRARQAELMAMASIAERRHREHQPDGRKVAAYVSANRWVADCPDDNSGIEVSPWNEEATCLHCGHIFKRVMPKDWEIGAALLEQRPLENRHWFPHRGETAKDLEAENHAHAEETAPPEPLVPRLPTPQITREVLASLQGKPPQLGARCPLCNRLGVGESAQKKCPNCGHEPQEAAYIVDEKCPGGDQCKIPVFHHPSGLHFWVFDGGWLAPNVRA